MTTLMIFESYWGDELPDGEDEELWMAEDSQSSAYKERFSLENFPCATRVGSYLLQSWFLSLDCVKHTFAQERKACLAIPLSFDQFQLGHVAFHHAVTDPPGETSSHGIFVFLDPSGKGLEFGKFAALHSGKPGIEVLSGACAQHLDKLLHQVIGSVDFWVDLTELDQCLLLLDTQFFRATKKQEGSLS